MRHAEIYYFRPSQAAPFARRAGAATFLTGAGNAQARTPSNPTVFGSVSFTFHSMNSMIPFGYETTLCERMIADMDTAPCWESTIFDCADCVNGDAGVVPVRLP